MNLKPTLHSNSCLLSPVRIGLVFIVLLFSSFTYGQNLQMLGKEKQMIIPFEYQQGFILVDVIFENLLPLKFIFDTGAENTILFKREFADAMHVTFHKRIRVMGSDLSQDIFAFVCNGVRLQLSTTQQIKQNMVVLESNQIFLEEYLGTKIDGILGADFFKGLVIQIDYRKKNLTIVNPAHFNKDKLKNFQVFDIEIVNSKPYLNAVAEVTAGKATEIKLLIDTGAGLSAMLHENTDSLLSIPSKIVKSSLGKGIGGDIEGFAGKIKSLSFGQIEFTNLVCSFQALDKSLIDPDKIIRNGLIGNILLERFDVVLDLLGSKLYLKPKKSYNKNFEYDRSGLTIFSFGKNFDEYYVRDIVENSPASVADIRSGDIIIKVGIWSRKWYSLTQLNHIFTKKAGTKIKITIKRNDEILKKTIVLRDLI